LLPGDTNSLVANWFAATATAVTDLVPAECAAGGGGKAEHEHDEDNASGAGFERRWFVSLFHHEQI
jgi:hypothetical protein